MFPFLEINVLGNFYLCTEKDPVTFYLCTDKDPVSFYLCTDKDTTLAEFTVLYQSIIYLLHRFLPENYPK